MNNIVIGIFSLVLLVASTAQAEIVEFIATGSAGEGLLPGNIDPVTSSAGSGGIGAGGITLDTDTNILSIDVEWGSENGYSDLTGEITLLHLHGPTPSLPPFNFGEVNSDILINLGNSLNFNSSASGGGLVDQFFVSNQEEEYLLSGRTYINVHTAAYPTGEIRGYLLRASAVPEPSATLLLGGILLSAASRRRKSL